MMVPLLTKSFRILKYQSPLLLHLPYTSSSYHRATDSYTEIDDGNKMDEMMKMVEESIMPKLFSNIKSFRPGQKEVITSILEGKSCLAILPTGAGKSLCYMLPSQLLDGLTIVVSPLLAMMRDQVAILQSQGIPAGRLDSSMEYDDIKYTINEIRSARIRILYVSPERFNNEGFRNIMKNIKVSMFVVDEAHCISEWGHAFRPDYLRLSSFASISNAQVILAVTATATQRVANDIIKRLGIDPENIVRLPSVRRNLDLQVQSFSSADGSYEERCQLVLKVLQEINAKATAKSSSIIIYVSKQKLSNKLANYLSSNGFSARAYHSGLTTEERESIEDWFLSHEVHASPMTVVSDANPSIKGKKASSCKSKAMATLPLTTSVSSNPDHSSNSMAIVVGTIAFGMGVDCDSVRSVIHFDLPRSVEDYVQGVGRAGRDNQPAMCLAMMADADVPSLKSQIYGSTPQLSNLQLMADTVFGKPGAYKVNEEKDKVLYMSYYDVSHACDINELALRLCMSHLVQRGLITELTSVYGFCKVKVLDRDKLQALISSKNIDELVSVAYDIEELNDYSAAELNSNKKRLYSSLAALLVNNLETYPRRKVVEIDTIAVSNTYKTTPKEIVSAINVFNELNITESGGFSKIHNRYRVLQHLDTDTIVDLLHAHGTDNEGRALLRVDEVAQLLRQGSKRPQEMWDYIGEYFREDGVENGRDDGGLGHVVSGSSSSSCSSSGSLGDIDIDESVWTAIAGLVAAKVLPRGDPYLLARFAAGVTSPRIVKGKYTKLDEFGSAASLDWDTILKRCKSIA